MADNQQTLGEFKDDLERMLNISASDFGSAAERMSAYANEINKTFGQGRQRMVELMQTVTDITPRINRLGGEIQDVQKTISAVADASRRNVVANMESVEALYAADKLLGIDAKTLSDSFLNVGISIQALPKQLEESMAYVRSIGGNTKQVMSDVQSNMDQMNRYQFEGGVQGLTKMAAQASMLRFNMNETFRLAEKVIDPEGAIEVASAFQRLGVSAGNLVDPFQLMNQSINDPAGLQTSLADISKQFTYFDEKTKSFKINPQGVLTLREMEKQTGVSAAELSKMGLAAAELDKRLSAVSSAGLRIASEEDKQYLANIATMTKDGNYQVTLNDGTKKDLQQLNQEEFDKLIEEQKNGPKTLEELSRSQLNISETIKNDLSAIRSKFLGGIVSARQITTNMEAAQRMVKTTTGEFSNKGTTQDVRFESEKFIGSVTEFLKDLNNPNKSKMDSFQKFLTNAGVQIESIAKRLSDTTKETMSDVASKQTNKTAIERGYADQINSLIGGRNTQLSNQPISSLIEGERGVRAQTATKEVTKISEQKTTITLGGNIKVDVNLPDGFAQLDTEKQQKLWDAMLNSQQFKQMVANLASDKNPTKQPVNTGYNR
jgi:hypothetical protein